MLRPGSDEARAAGCCCPVLDNGRGQVPPYPCPRYGRPDHSADCGACGWYIVVGCPVHSEG